MSRELVEKSGWGLRHALSVAGGRRRLGVASAVFVAAFPVSAALESPIERAATGSDATAESSAIVASSSTEQLTCRGLARRRRWLAPDVRQRREGESENEWRARLAEAVLVESALARVARAAGVERRTDFVAAWESRRQGLLVGELERGFLAGGEASPAEVAAFYAADPGRFRLGERIATRFILLKLGAEAETAQAARASARLEQIRASFLATGGFGELARRHSEAENAARGGAVAASTRGSLLAEYEDVAWQLEPGEVSRPVRLPAGMAIIWLEQRFPAKELSLDEARKGIAKQLANQERERRREAALAEARAAWPLAIEWPAAATTEPTITLAGRALTLADLGLAHRPPRLAEEIERAIERRWLIHLAEERHLAEQPEIAQRLADLRHAILAGAALEDRVKELLPEYDEDALRAAYEKNAKALGEPEHRVFEVVRVAGSEGTMRDALAAAGEVAALWRRASKPLTRPSVPPASPEGWSVETWGPLSRSVLGNKVSPLVAKAAFGLDDWEISEPIRFERYDGLNGRFSADGYVVLRQVAKLAPTVPPFEAARENLRRSLARPLLPQLRATARAQIEAGLEVAVSVDDLAACALGEPGAKKRPRPGRRP